MQYRVESIGASFSDKEIGNFAKVLTARSNDGWELHSVFSVQKRGCLGTNEGVTYLAIYRKETTENTQ